MHLSLRLRTVAAAAALVLVGVVPASADDGVGPAESLLALRGAIEQGRLARAHVEVANLGSVVRSAWAEAVFAAAPTPPAGWTFDGPGGAVQWSQEGPVFVRTVLRGEQASVRLVVHTFAAEHDKPHEANAPWFQYWTGHDRAKEVAWGARKALLVMERGEAGAKEVGIRLPRGASLGVLADGLSSRELVATLAPAIDLVVLEASLERGEPAGDMKALGDLAIRAFRERRFAAAFEALRRLDADLDRGVRARVAGLLTATLPGWTAGEEVSVPFGAQRTWSRGSEASIEAYLVFDDAPNVNDLWGALNDPRSRRQGQRVLEADGRRVLVEVSSSDGAEAGRRGSAHVFFVGGRARLDVRWYGVSPDAGLLSFLPALRLARLEDRLATLW
jgi:hypothetical protein